VEGPLDALLADSFDHFRRCGTGRRECVVFWTGPLSDPERIDGVVHPDHQSGSFGYEIDVAWLKRFWLNLHEQQRTVRVQVHTHPRDAFHSATDDAYAVSQRPGFLSLVIPDFGLREVSLRNAALFELADSGEWRELTPASVLADAA
jgi:hypothetical protein